ncbi:MULTISPECIES: hypothetical protein [unclassified Streptomyces]|uniref:hypothetical protein n=1 Tax=unclassified Streptomyces TaxID=2593676 RepID=UPI0004BD7C39|nr:MULTISPECIES: hypothetical protein [unclassified Streptomyces]
MSTHGSNRHRTATLCARATGVPFTRCAQWAADGIITRHQPVPDGRTAAQRTFEARVAYVLANALRDEQVDGALLGVTGAVPTEDGLTLALHPQMAHRVIAELLPAFDSDFGGLRGVPGLRLDGDGASWTLRAVGSDARIRLTHPDPRWRPRSPEDTEVLTELWRRNPTTLDGREEEDLPAWSDTRGGPQPVLRDIVLSRLLRRPLLVNQAGAAHGWANTYGHAHTDLVIEWCCGTDQDEVERSLRRSGLVAAPPDGVDFRAVGGRPRARGTIALEDAYVVVRALGSCATGESTFTAEWITDRNRARYS